MQNNIYIFAFTQVWLWVENRNRRKYCDLPDIRHHSCLNALEAKFHKDCGIKWSLKLWSVGLSRPNMDPTKVTGLSCCMAVLDSSCLRMSVGDWRKTRTVRKTEWIIFNGGSLQNTHKHKPAMSIRWFNSKFNSIEESWTDLRRKWHGCSVKDAKLQKHKTETACIRNVCLHQKMCCWKVSGKTVSDIFSGQITHHWPWVCSSKAKAMHKQELTICSRSAHSCSSFFLFSVLSDPFISQISSFFKELQGRTLQSGYCVRLM